MEAISIREAKTNTFEYTLPKLCFSKKRLDSLKANTPINETQSKAGQNHIAPNNGSVETILTHKSNSALNDSVIDVMGGL